MGGSPGDDGTGTQPLDKKIVNSQSKCNNSIWRCIYSGNSLSCVYRGEKSAMGTDKHKVSIIIEMLSFSFPVCATAEGGKPHEASAESLRIHPGHSSGHRAVCGSCRRWILPGGHDPAHRQEHQDKQQFRPLRDTQSPQQGRQHRPPGGEGHGALFEGRGQEHRREHLVSDGGRLLRLQPGCDDRGGRRKPLRKGDHRHWRQQKTPTAS